MKAFKRTVFTVGHNRIFLFGIAQKSAGKGVIDMIAQQEICSGGEEQIIFHKTETNYSDEVNRLIENCKTSRESLEILYNMFKKNVFAVAFSITCDYHLSEDCVAETFVRLTQVRKFSPRGGDGKGFILTIARNVALEQRRQYKKNCINFIIQSYGDADKTVEDSIFVNQLLKNLSDKQRQIVMLKCYSELTFKEIAVLLKCPEGTIKSRYQKAIEILRRKAGADNE